VGIVLDPPMCIVILPTAIGECRRGARFLPRDHMKGKGRESRGYFPLPVWRLIFQAKKTTYYWENIYRRGKTITARPGKAGPARKMLGARAGEKIPETTLRSAQESCDEVKKILHVSNGRPRTGTSPMRQKGQSIDLQGFSEFPIRSTQ